MELDPCSSGRMHVDWLGGWWAVSGGRQVIPQPEAEVRVMAGEPGGHTARLVEWWGAGGCQVRTLWSEPRPAGAIAVRFGKRAACDLYGAACRPLQPGAALALFAAVASAWLGGDGEPPAARFTRVDVAVEWGYEAGKIQGLWSDEDSSLEWADSVADMVAPWIAELHPRATIVKGGDDSRDGGGNYTRKIQAASMRVNVYGRPEVSWRVELQMRVEEEFKELAPGEAFATAGALAKAAFSAWSVPVVGSELVLLPGLDSWARVPSVQAGLGERLARAAGGLRALAACSANPDVELEVEKTLKVVAAALCVPFQVRGRWGPWGLCVVKEPTEGTFERWLQKRK